MLTINVGQYKIYKTDPCDINIAEYEENIRFHNNKKSSLQGYLKVERVNWGGGGEHAVLVPYISASYWVSPEHE